MPVGVIIALSFLLGMEIGIIIVSIISVNRQQDSYDKGFEDGKRIGRNKMLNDAFQEKEEKRNEIGFR